MWVSLISQTGSEVAAIQNKLGIKPDYIFRDREDGEINPKIKNQVKIMSHKGIMEQIQNWPNAIITLNGYLRVIPDKIIDTGLKIYNVHPGDIVKYPSLKGIHPQKKALQMGLEETGVVIHEVDKTVDGGEIIDYQTYKIKKDENLAGLINELRLISIDMWIKFLNKKLNLEDV